MKSSIQGLGRAFLSLVYPITCQICHRKLTENKGLCEDCISKIHKNESGIAACRYGGVLKEAVHLFKYKGVLSMLNTFSYLLTEFIDRNIDMRKINTIIPVPLHSVSLRERGFNQAHALSLSIAKRYKKPISTGNLIKAKATKPQSGLNRNQRLKNLKSAFLVKKAKSLRGKNVLLVDDVYTTGITMKMASDVLYKAGAANVKVIALAKGV